MLTLYRYACYHFAYRASHEPWRGPLTARPQRRWWKRVRGYYGLQHNAEGKLLNCAAEGG